MLLIGLFSISSGEFLEIVCGATPAGAVFNRPIEDHFLPLFPYFDFSSRRRVIDNLWIAWMLDPDQSAGTIQVRFIVLHYPLDFACVHGGILSVVCGELQQLRQAPSLQASFYASVPQQDEY